MAWGLGDKPLQEGDPVATGLGRGCGGRRDAGTGDGDSGPQGASLPLVSQPLLSLRGLLSCWDLRCSVCPSPCPCPLRGPGSTGRAWGVTACWGQRGAMPPCMLLTAEPQQPIRCLAPLCCPGPSPGAGFQSRSTGLSQAGSDCGSAKVCRAGAGAWPGGSKGGVSVPCGACGAFGISSQTCWDLTWAGWGPTEPWDLHPLPSPNPLCLCSQQPGPPSPLVFLASLVHVASAGRARAARSPLPLLPHHHGSLPCDAAGARGAAGGWAGGGAGSGCRGGRGCMRELRPQPHAGTNS